VWGAQLEQLPFASSYIPTQATAVTRAADVRIIDGKDNAPDYNGDQTLSVDVISGEENIAAGNTSFSETGSGIRFVKGRSTWNSGKMVIIFGLSADRYYITDWVTSGKNLEKHRITATLKDELGSVYVDGVLDGTVAVTVRVTAYSDMAIDNQSNTITSNERIWDRALTATEVNLL